MSPNNAQIQVEAVLAEKKKWLADSFNEQFLCQKSLETLDEFIAGREAHIGRVLNSLSSLSHWYGAKGILEIIEGRLSNYLCDSFWFDLFSNTIMSSSFQKQQKEGAFRSVIKGKPWPPGPRISFNDQGLLLAQSFALGLVPLGEAIAHQSLTGLKDGLFFGLSQNNLTPFVISVFAKWKNMDLAADDFPFVIPEAYAALRDNLTSEPDELRPLVMTACDFHLYRSQEHTDDETYEFYGGQYQIYPVEILFIFRIRQILGLSNPEVDHPLLNSPLGKLPETRCSISAQFEPLRDKIRNEYPAWPAAADS